MSRLAESDGFIEAARRLAELLAVAARRICITPTDPLSVRPAINGKH